MSLQLEIATRVFKYDDLVLTDPDTGMTPEEVLEFYKDVYPELTAGSVGGPELSEDGEAVTYTFERHVGKKG